MKKLAPIIVVGLIVVLVLGYLGRHQIKSMLGLAPAAPVTQTSNTNSAPSDNIYLTKTDAAKGKYMTDFQGKTLYTYDKDTNGVSNCTGGCLVIWPPYTSGATAEGSLPTDITVITKSDGSKQFAWKGMPLYYFSSDNNAGDIKGDGVGNVWHIVKL